MAVSSWIAQESAGMLPELLPASPPAAICWAGALPCSEHPQILEPSSFLDSKRAPGLREQNNQQKKPRKTL